MIYYLSKILSIQYSIIKYRNCYGLNVCVSRKKKKKKKIMLEFHASKAMVLVGGNSGGN